MWIRQRYLLIILSLGIVWSVGSWNLLTPLRAGIGYDDCGHALPIPLGFPEPTIFEHFDVDIFPIGDHDFYSFEVPAGEVWAVDIETISDHPGTFTDDTILRLWGACNNVFAEDLIAWDDDGGEQWMSHLQTDCTLAEGIYYIDVGGFNDTSVADNITLRVEATAKCDPLSEPPVPAAGRAERKISQTRGGFDGVLSNQDWFGRGVTGIGNPRYFAVGALFDDSGGNDAGSFWQLILDDYGVVLAEGEVTGSVPLSHFGTAVEWLPLIASNDKAVAVGSPDVGTGSVRVMAFDEWPDPTPLWQVDLDSGTIPLSDGDWFGYGLAALGDLDGPGPSEQTLAVGAPEGGGTGAGAVWILSLNALGDVIDHQKIADGSGGLAAGTLEAGGLFGYELAALGDLDGPGPSVGALAVGAPGAHGLVGSAWVLLLGSDGTGLSHVEITSQSGGFSETLDADRFGIGVGSLGDLDGAGVSAHTLAVGAYRDDDGGLDRGALWVLFLASDGTVDRYTKISDTEGGFDGRLDDDDLFGIDVASLGDFDGTGPSSLTVMVGAAKDDDGGLDRGALWLLELEHGCAVRLEMTRTDLQWGGPSISGGQGFDVVSGNLATLRSSGGDFSNATESCTSLGTVPRVLDHTSDPAGTWFLVRRVSGAGKCTYDTGSAFQSLPRDPGIFASSHDCP